MKILIIEDDRFVRDLYQRQFAQEGYEVYTAADGPDGLVQATETHPDLILLDIMLPKLNGLDLLKTLKSKGSTKKIRVVLLTNLGQESVIKQGFRLGAEGYFIKSAYSPSQIVEAIKKFLPDKKT